MSLFSPLTSKIYGALSVALLTALIIASVTAHRTTSKLEKIIQQRDAQIAKLNVENLTLKNNQLTLENAVNQCSAGVKLAAAKADQAAAAGLAALEQARKNHAGVVRKLDAIDALPAQTCADAEAILRAGAQ